MVYTVRLKPRAEGELDQLPILVARRIWRKLLALEQEPRPRGTVKLEDSEGYRIRIGDYRIVYTFASSEKVVEIQAVKHRKDVYR